MLENKKQTNKQKTKTKTTTKSEKPHQDRNLLHRLWNERVQNREDNRIFVAWWSNIETKEWSSKGGKEIQPMKKGRDEKRNKKKSKEGFWKEQAKNK